MRVLWLDMHAPVLSLLLARGDPIICEFLRGYRSSLRGIVMFRQASSAYDGRQHT